MNVYNVPRSRPTNAVKFVLITLYAIVDVLKSMKTQRDLEFLKNVFGQLFSSRIIENVEYHTITSRRNEEKTIGHLSRHVIVDRVIDYLDK